MAREREFWKDASEKADQRLAELRAERDDLTAQLETVNNQILQWERIVQSLKPVTAGKFTISTVRVIENIAKVSLTDACRAILRQVDEHLTAKGIRDILQANGYQPGEKHSNPLASIHGVLKRLSESGEAEQFETGGKTFYRRKQTVKSKHTPIEQALGLDPSRLDDLLDLVKGSKETKAKV